MKKDSNPFKRFGEMLGDIRSRMQESLVEASGAVEIASETLETYEKGLSRPSEDVLELLISHYSLKDDEATKLWKLAGYNDSKQQDDLEEPIFTQQPIMLLPFDARIIYTDTMNVTIDKHGVVINFMQNAGQPGQHIPAARVGMSLEYAKKVADTLQQTIKKAMELPETKNLPSPKDDKNKS